MGDIWRDDLPMIAALFFVTIAFLSAHSAIGEVLRVPSVYGTIQFALSGVTEGDTIQIAPGVYVESLVAPPIEFVMMGETSIDSQATEFSIIDPTDLPGSDTLRCLTLTGGKAAFFDLVFRNRSGMTEGRLASNPAGVRGDTTVREATFERCIFDSVVGGVARIERIEMRSCRYIGSLGSALYTGQFRGKLIANNTWFDGATGGLVTSGRGCLIQNCLFTLKGTLRMLVGLGDSLIIEDCRFVGLDTLNGQAVLVRPRCGSIIRDCTFENIVVGFDAVLDIIDTCFHQTKDWSCAFQLVNNRFVNCGSRISEGRQGGEMIYVHCSENSTQGFIALIDSNRIDSTRNVLGQASGILLSASASIRNTIFGDALTQGKPQIAIWDRAVHDTAYFRHNSFSQDYPGIEFFFIEGNSVNDARWNWWGHESGPYHPVNNPQGQGASVDDDIRFNPWLLSDPDTTSGGDTTEYVDPSEHEALLAKFALSSYPNPFNATTTLVIEVNHPGEYEVLVYDLMGREVRQLFAGRIDGRREIRFDGADLASGIYFARLSGASGAIVTAKVLLLK